MKKEFKLIDERKKLLEKLELPDWFYDAILEQDKEFIKRLKEDLAPINAGEGFKFYRLFCDTINARAGDLK